MIPRWKYEKRYKAWVKRYDLTSRFSLLHVGVTAHGKAYLGLIELARSYEGPSAWDTGSGLDAIIKDAARDLRAYAALDKQRMATARDRQRLQIDVASRRVFC